jgi:hypothetical protein
MLDTKATGDSTLTRVQLFSLFLHTLHPPLVIDLATHSDASLPACGTLCIPADFEETIRLRFLLNASVFLYPRAVHCSSLRRDVYARRSH